MKTTLAMAVLALISSSSAFAGSEISYQPVSPPMILANEASDFHIVSARPVKVPVSSPTAVAEAIEVSVGFAWSGMVAAEGEALPPLRFYLPVEALSESAVEALRVSSSRFNPGRNGNMINGMLARNIFELRVQEKPIENGVDSSAKVVSVELKK